MKKTGYRAGLALLALLLALLLASCTIPNIGGTTAPTTTIGDPTDLSPLTDSEFASFMSLVDDKKVEYAEAYYQAYYIGEFRTLKACKAELEDAIRNMAGIRSVGDVDTATAVYIGAYARALGDNYGYYYPPENYDDYTEDISGEYTGIGIMVTLLESGYAEILSVFSGSPAEDAGLLPGDILVAVGGEDFAVIGYQNAIDLIRGLEGTTVTVTLERDGLRFDATMPRRRVTEQTVDYKMLAGNVGFIRISSFDDTTYTQFVEAHRALDAEGAESYVFDVRNNPGGTLTAVVAVLEYILPDAYTLPSGHTVNHIVTLNYKVDMYDATIASIYDFDPSFMNTRTYYEGHAITEPMVVLANGNTASAGELFTSSLQDYDVAQVIGEQTFGKGIGQSSFSIGRDGSALVMTVFSYDPPVQPNYQDVGILPDVAVSLSEEAASKNIYKLTLDEDAQLKAALASLGAE